MIIVHDNTAGKGDAADVLVDLKVDKSESPVEDLRRLLTENYKKSSSENALVSTTEARRGMIVRFGMSDRRR
jgi:uncharacterized Ntn-hydrolase superfamily protein